MTVFCLLEDYTRKKLLKENRFFENQRISLKKRNCLNVNILSDKNVFPSSEYKDSPKVLTPR